MCYNCGSEERAARTARRPTPTSPSPSALSAARQVISRACPKNAQGIYINGGACKICKGTDHLAKDCPSKDKCLRCGQPGHISSECPNPNGGKFAPAKKVKTFAGGPTHGRGKEGAEDKGGDDLEDDFEEELGDALGRDAKEADGNEGENESDEDDGAADLEWEKDEDERVLRDRGKKDKSKKRGSGEERGGHEEAEEDKGGV